MVAVIYKNGEQINRIVADEEFAAAYCAEKGYTYTMEPDPPKPNPDPEPEPDPSDTPVTWSALADSIRKGVNEV